MEIKKVVKVSIEDVNGNEIKPGQRVWYTKENSTELFYGQFIELNKRGNIIFENPITDGRTSVMPKVIKNIYCSLTREG